MDKREAEELYPRYLLLLRLTMKEVKYLRQIKRESNIPMSFYIRTLIDKKMEERDGGRDGNHNARAY